MKNKILSLVLVSALVFSAIFYSSANVLAESEHENRNNNGLHLGQVLREHDHFQIKSSDEEQEDQNESQAGQEHENENNDQQGENDNNSNNSNNQQPDNIQQIIQRLQDMIARLEAEIQQLLSGNSQSVYPVISGVLTTNIASSSSVITWFTNQPATSQVRFGTTASYGSSSPLDSTLVTSHSQTLTGLAANTTYHFQVISANALSNSSASGDFTFTTADITAPLISAVSVNSISSSSAAVVWTTNEPSNSTVFYSTTSPINLSTAASITSSALVTSHSSVLNGLSASTTYFFVVRSTDASSNTATSSQSSFVTAP